jgi:ABC-type dipeptide/oligopeptide/nickel transport system permease subunit
MSEVEISLRLSEKEKEHVSEFQRVIKVMFDRSVVVGSTFVIIVLIFIAIFAPWLTTYKPNAMDLKSSLAHPSKVHLLGTDELGRDLLSRIIYGARISLLVGIVAVAMAGIIGMGLGLIAGHFGGWINIIIMRFIDSLLALPPLVLILAITAVLGGGLTNVLVALGIGMMPTYCRLMCGQILSVKESEFITAARLIGAKNLRIMFLHLLPNSLPPLLVLVTMNLGTAILMEATLSFLGIGIIPPTATWGAMVSGGYKYLLSNPVISFAPGVAILLVVLAFNMVGDGLRDALDPRLRGIL